MAQYKKIENGNIVNIIEASAEFAAANGYVPVADGDYVEHIVDETYPINIIEAKYARDEKLKSSDWTQMPDSPLSDSDKASWATYRQALRDLPDHADWPNVDWPTKP